MLSRESEIIDLYLDGYSIDEIGCNLSYSSEDVLNKIIDYRAERVVRLTNDLEYDDEHLVAVKEFVKESIEKIQKRSGIEERRRINSMIKLMEDGMNMAGVGNIFSISRERARQILKAYAPELLLANESNRYKICSVCGEKKRGIQNKGIHEQICDSCYKKIINENKKRWSKEYEKCIDCGTTTIPHNTKGRCRKCAVLYLYHYDLDRKKSIKKSGDKWRKNNVDKVRAINKRVAEKQMKNALGGNREKALRRDGYKCAECGLSEADSQAKYSRTLFVSHVGDKDDDRLKNLITLCVACHNNTYSRSKRVYKKN